MKKLVIALSIALAFVCGLWFQSATDPMNSIYTMEGEVIESDGYNVAVVLENGHVYEFERSGLEVGMFINIMMHDNDSPRDVTDDYPVM